MGVTINPEDYEARVIDALRTVREVSGIDAKALSLLAGLGHNQVGRIERGERHANLATLARLLDAMHEHAPRRTNVASVYELLEVAEGRRVPSVAR